MKTPFGTGADESAFDARTIEHTTEATALPGKGGVDYTIGQIENQHTVGICTAISVVQRREKDTGKKYSPDFHYLLQKKIYEKSWYEGSSLFISLKVAKNIGFLPIDLFPYVTEQDRFLPYTEYIKKLQAIPDEEVTRLMALCIDKIPGYAHVNVNADSIAQAISDQPNGILCRYDCGSTWWVPSWKPEDINPLRRPIPATSGHAIIMNKYNYTDNVDMQMLTNTWGTLWCKEGTADINFSDYAPTEAWTFLNFVPDIPTPRFTKTLRIGMTDSEVKELQRVLGVKQTGFFFVKTKAAVINFQIRNGLKDDGIVGPQTIKVLNKLFP